jgi:tellurite resistance protein
MMFLNRLTLKEKEAFLNLAHYIAHVDDEFCDKERDIIDKYCMEMQVDDVEWSPESFSLSVVLDAFKEESHKKIVLLEIMALVFSDGHLHQSEEETLNVIIRHFGLNPNLGVVYKEWAKSILSLFVQGEALIHL